MEEGPKKNQTVKMLVTWALNEFGGGYKSDKRMLDLWKLMVNFFLFFWVVRKGCFLGCKTAVV